MVIGLHAELGRGIAMNDDFKFFNERLFYDSETGIFYWKNTELVSWVVRGKKAGSIYRNGYLVIQVKKNDKHVRISGHRLAWFFAKGHFPETAIDHINGNKTDNRIENLRLATYAQNNQNKTKPYKNNKTGVLGVFLDKGKYRAVVRLNGKGKHIGMFDTIEEASNAYILAKRELHGFCTI